MKITMQAGIALGGIMFLPALAHGQAAIPTASPPVPSLAVADSPDARRIADGQIVDRTSPVTDEDLAGNRAGETIVSSSQTLSAVTTGNVLNGNYAAGSVILSDQALSNFNGIGNFAINTGAQVSIQSGMNLTINITQ